MKWQNPTVDYREFFEAGNSPSILQYKSDNIYIKLEDEYQFRFLGSHLIQRAGRLLKMPQAGIMTGQILFQQFYCQQSFFKYPLLDVAMACTLIAGKVEECYRRIRDVINIFNWVYQKTTRPSVSPQRMNYVGEEYYRWRDRVTAMEMTILHDLGFHVQPRHPVGLLANYLNALELSDDPRISQKALNYLNDALRGLAYVCYQPEVIACAAIEMAANDFGIGLPQSPPWYLVFDVPSEADLLICQGLMRRVYRTPLDPSLPMLKESFLEYLEERGYTPPKEADDHYHHREAYRRHTSHRSRSPSATRHRRHRSRSRSHSRSRSRGRSRRYHHHEHLRHSRRSPSRSKDRPSHRA